MTSDATSEFADGARLSSAVIAYTGWGRLSFPHNDREVLIEKYGPYSGNRVAEEIELILREALAAMDSSPAGTLKASAVARSGIRSRHPELSADALDALGWWLDFSLR